jgi:hypothetical protein
MNERSGAQRGSRRGVHQAGNIVGAICFHASSHEVGRAGREHPARCRRLECGSVRVGSAPRVYDRIRRFRGKCVRLSLENESVRPLVRDRSLSAALIAPTVSDRITRFDLENPSDLARLADPMLALQEPTSRSTGRPSRSRATYPAPIPLRLPYRWPRVSGGASETPPLPSCAAPGGSSPHVS